jgi:hypothetical protein
MKNITLLGINVFKFTAAEISEFREPGMYPMPTFCVTNDTGEIKYSQSYLQFIGIPGIKEEGSFYLFEQVTACDLLSHEIGNCGLDDLLQDIDLRLLFDCLEFINFSDFKKKISMTSYLAIEMNYTGGGYDDDWDLDIRLHGYLNKEKEMVKAPVPHPHSIA